MAAPTKKGLDYYPRDINLMMDRKFRKPKMKYGYLAIVIYDALLELIYGDEGYYVRYSESNKDDVAWDILDRIRGKYNVESETIYEVIEMLVECELFSDYHFKQGIITSKRIQKVYYKSTVERKNVEVDKKIWFLTISEMETISSKSSILSFFINQPINEDNQPINEDNQPINSQSKVKESKPNNSKVNQTKINEWFELVWSAYPKKIKKQEAFKEFCSLDMSENLLSVIVNAINKQKSQEQWQTEGGKYIPSLVNWLKNRRWEDEINDKGYIIRKGTDSFNNFTQKIYSDEFIKERLRAKGQTCI
jgi:hypothetical protein